MEPIDTLVSIFDNHLKDLFIANLPSFLGQLLRPVLQMHKILLEFLILK